ncbi:MAG: STAS domain-containing protein [Ignavibacteriales bacterium]|nr:MAG: STAS domain-containing protein [Ignavibacteriaceae bacterium]MBW7874045.1 STAS domain-containing protein [Ignavibacteria bacterium]MCZ2143145.1 STAS domain-containing protein [Ignavibacteriales bacterium]OQY74016.1 MAG: anti-anti-sigma factor [Ignavibacteriales bacterium UTCHB3]MBV6444025.1 putative anti-sigma factor antagonist BtrV [Ignavibacteriaceae bacterium]
MADFKSGLRDKDEFSIIDLSGYLDAHTAPELETRFTNLIDKNRFKVVVNLKDLEYISSAGLGVFMAYIETMRENQGDIKLVSLKPSVYSIFDLLGFPLLYDIMKDEEEAINKFKEQGK